MQWGDNLVFWVGDKAIGGKMFALVNLEESAPGGKQQCVISYSTRPERYTELLEQEGITPAPYFARIHWVAMERWDVLRDSEWLDELRTAHSITLGKLPKRTLAVLAMPARERGRYIAARRNALAAKTK